MGAMFKRAFGKHPRAGRPANRMRTTLPLVAVLAALLLAGCRSGLGRESSPNLPSAGQPSAGQPSARPPRPPVVDEPKADAKKSKALVGVLNGFSGKLYGSVARQQKGNLAVSPLGAFVLCEVLAEGASGEAKAALDTTLQRSRAGMPEVAHLVWQMNQLPPVWVAQKLYLDEGLKFQKGFLQRLSPVLDEPVVSLPLTAKPQESADAINRWVSLETGGLFTHAVDPPGPNTLCLAVSTFFFEGRWDYPFQKDETNPQKFTLADKTSVEVPTMHLSDRELDLFAVKGGKGLRLPYEDGAEMVLFLPDEGKTPDQILAEVDTAVRLREYTPEGLRVTVELPSFEFRVHGLDLGPALSGMGLGSALKRADYSEMLEGQKGIDVPFQQETFLKVDEEGTTAAAVTVAYPSAAATPGEIPKFRYETIRFNRPFAFLLRDAQTGAVLMMGRVDDPRASGEKQTTGEERR